MLSSRVSRGFRALMEAARARARAKASSAAAEGARPRNIGIMKPMPVSPAMRKFLGGTTEISRAEAVKKVWDHIKLHQLQNPANKREICCDENLKAIFDGKDKVGMLEIAKLLSPHFLKSN